ncbi:MAG: hypothetical protein J5846_09055 [Desulfovibrio sp.]|nr:hypothetical protein [Desulfovibrio sp.]
MAIDALFPAPQLSLDMSGKGARTQDLQTYSITGGKNQAMSRQHRTAKKTPNNSETELS